MSVEIKINLLQNSQGQVTKKGQCRIIDYSAILKIGG